MSDFKFSCPLCGQHLAGTAAWSGKTIQCPACQRDLVVPDPPATATSPVPANQPPAAVRLMGAAAPSAPPPVTPRRPEVNTATRGSTSGLAVAALCLGIGSFLMSVLAGIPAVICGHMALSRIRSGRAAGGKGLAIAGLVMGYLSIVGAIVMVSLFSLVFMRARSVVLNPPQGVPATARTRATPTQAEPKVKTDPDAVEIPDAPVAGVLHGGTFTCDWVRLQNGILELSHGESFTGDQSVKLFLFTQPGEKLEGKTYRVSASSTGMNPHVHLRWPKGSSAQTDNYCLRLEFGELKNGKRTGKIYLELSEPRQTKLAGTFSATVQ